MYNYGDCGQLELTLKHSPVIEIWPLFFKINPMYFSLVLQRPLINWKRTLVTYVVIILELSLKQH